MFSKSKRINRKDFDNVLMNGKVFHGKTIYIRYIKGKSGELKRFSVVVPKKVLSGAVKRHFLRRKVVKSLKCVEENCPSGDFLIFIKKEFLINENSDINSELQDIVKYLVQ